MIVFFFKQKTAYEMRISDWSSDVCSSDLSPRSARRPRRRPARDGAISRLRTGPTMSQYWHRRVLCGTRARNRVVRKRNLAIDSYETSPPADGAVPARGPSFRAPAIRAFLPLLIGIAAGGWAGNRWLGGSNFTHIGRAPGR